MKTMKFYKKIFLFKLRSGAKYTEAEHQQALMGLKRENRWHFYDFTVKGQAVTDNNLKDMLAGKLKIFFSGKVLNKWGKNKMKQFSR